MAAAPSAQGRAGFVLSMLDKADNLMEIAPAGYRRTVSPMRRSRQDGDDSAPIVRLRVSVKRLKSGLSTAAPIASSVVTFAVALGLTGCASIKGTLVPVSDTVPGASKVDMLVATTRMRATDPQEFYSGGRGPELSFAEFTVSIPPAANRKEGEVQWPQSVPGNPATDFVTLKADVIDRKQATAWFHRTVRSVPQRRVLVFIHGFNNRFDDAVFRFAQIVHDAGTPVVPVLFTWPSRGSVLSYGYDRESTNYSRDGLEQVLNMLAQDRSVSEVDILAHSMGNWLTLETLRQMAIRNRHVPTKIVNVMLAAPDVDVDVFGNEIANITEPRPNFTLLVSQDDHALAVSRHVWGSTARIGAIDPQAEPYKSQLAAEHVAVVDLTKRDTDDNLNHDKFAESPELVQLIGRRLETGQSIDDWHEGLGDRVIAATTGAASSVGTAAGIAVAVPVSIVDPVTRSHLSDDVNELENELGDVATAAIKGRSAR